MTCPHYTYEKLPHDSCCEWPMNFNKRRKIRINWHRYQVPHDSEVFGDKWIDGWMSAK